MSNVAVQLFPSFNVTVFPVPSPFFNNSTSMSPGLNPSWLLLSFHTLFTCTCVIASNMIFSKSSSSCSPSKYSSLLLKSFPWLFSFPIYPSSVVTKSSLFTSGVVPGSESVSAFSSVVMILSSSASYSSDIHATFVNIVSSFPAVAVTSHTTCIISESNVVPPL